MKKLYFIPFTIIFVFLSTTIFSQNKTEKKITIQVRDFNNKPVPGAIILFDNVRQKSWTNSSGVLKIKTTNAPVEISAFSPKLGIKKIKYNGQKKIKITIPKGDKKLLITDNKEKKRDPSQFWSIYDYLRGNIAGVHVTPTNVIRVRGYGTVNGSMEPLFILNGTNIDQETFGRIRPNLIKSVRVLKGPETAIYGSRGANGVIIIETL
ncbi:Plug domain-containing protein [Tenacibaculum sp. 190130A14a]|uniref:Plug domain-containing protein n=1 Tax=Tenacibaculum polynesiense TaxID=3137857 RepID=A0ABM9PD97_9FLAO